MSPSQVFEFTTEDMSELVRLGCQLAFLDEFRIIGVTRYSSPDSPEVLVFNTLAPQGQNLQRFKLPSEYRNRHANIHLDHYRTLGVSDEDGPLAVDSTKGIVLLEFCQPQVFLILRTQTLIKRVDPMSTDVQIPWDEWGGGAMAVEAPDVSYRLIAIHGSHVLALLNDGEAGRHTRVFDFSPQGSDRGRFLGGEDSGTERRAVPVDDEVGSLRPLDGSIVSHTVSLFPCFALEDTVD
jgi:hypothetical protein